MRGYRDVPEEGTHVPIAGTWRDMIAEMVEVLEFGATKHGDDDYLRDPGWRDRYIGKALGHVGKWLKGERADPETGKHPLAHAAADLVLLAARERRDALGEKSRTQVGR